MNRHSWPASLLSSEPLHSLSWKASSKASLDCPCEEVQDAQDPWNLQQTKLLHQSALVELELSPEESQGKISQQDGPHQVAHPQAEGLAPHLHPNMPRPFALQELHQP